MRRRTTPSAEIATVCMFGHFAPDYPRNRQVHETLTSLGYTVEQIQQSGSVRRRWPRLARDARTLPFDALWVAFLGYSDVPIAWAISRWRRVPLVFDAFVLLHDTFVTDRATVRRRSTTAGFLRALEIVACHLADVVVVDTVDHAERLARRTRLNRSKVRVLHVGAQDDDPCARSAPGESITAAFCGSFIPLHGADVIVRAAALVADDPDIRFVLIGDGQTKAATVELARTLGCDNVEFAGPSHGDALHQMLCRADVLLGVFGTSPKAMVVVPNKVVDALALGRPVITAATPAVRRILDAAQVRTVPPGDPTALAAAVRELARDPARRDALARAGRVAYDEHFSLAARQPEMAIIMRAARDT